ncbi:MAG TPA: STAS domain-containing protein [Ilumatobacteraceae bacterium]|nr:STAS domain-containing protein [Ilumatobacteraceae bacterium]
MIRAAVSTVGGSVVVTVDGIVDLAAIPTLHDELVRTIRLHPGQAVVVDLDAVGSIDDTGLGVLMGAAATARDGGGDLVVVCNHPALRARLDTTRFDRAVEVRATIT